MKKTIFFFICVVFQFLQTNYLFSQRIGEVTQGVSVLNSSIWAEPTCEVCWENPEANNATERDWVRQAITRTWEAQSAFRFRGWGACNGNSRGIRILIADTGPHVKELGRHLDGKQNGMELNFTFNNWSTGCKGKRQSCIESIAVHEFGHALGIAHEHNDCKFEGCTDAPQGTTGDYRITPCDLRSVMNYCNPQWNGNGNLSVFDIQGVVSLYGSRHPTWNTLDGSIQKPKVISWGKDRIDAFARGSDGSLWHRAWNGSQWTQWGTLGGQILPNTEISISSWSQNRLDIFAVGSEKGIWHLEWNGNRWSKWENLGGKVSSSPVAVSWGQNRIDIFARGTEGALWHKAWNGSDWEEWGSLGGQILPNTEISVTSWESNRLDIFVTGMNRSLWHKAWGGTWQDWEDLSGKLTSSPSSVCWGKNRIDVFARGDDGSVWHKAWTGKKWNDWFTIEGSIPINSKINAISQSPNKLDVFVIGADNGLWYNKWTGNDWWGWEGLGGSIREPTCVSSKANRLDCFGVGDDNALWHLPWNGKIWGY
jgi:Fungal fucose-specific lectin